MRSGTIALLAGVLGFQTLHQLPSAALWAVAIGGMTLLVILLRRRRASHRFVTILAAASAGFVLAGGHAHFRLASALPAELEGRDLLLVGRVAGLPEPDSRRIRFRFEPEALSRPDGTAVAMPGTLRLSWYGRYPALAPGQRWQMTVRLKRPHGLMNPGGFDYERWLFREGIRALGYVRQRPAPVRLAPAAGGLDAIRATVAERVEHVLAGRPHRALIAALTVGDRRGISDAHWDVLTATGTNHLMAISGLHIGLVAGLVFVLARWGWQRCARCCLRLPAPRAAAMAALVGAAGYAALAGFSVPTQRALVMTAVALTALFIGRPVASGRTLAAALLAVLLVDPLAVLAWGFWLSFGAVGAILWAAAGRLQIPGRMRQWGRVQMVVTLGLAPLLLVAFGAASWTAPLVNLVAIPWVGFLVVPPALAGVVLLPVAPTAAAWLLIAAETMLRPLWSGMELAGGTLPLPVVPPLWTLLPAGAGLLLLLAPRGVPLRSLGTLGLLPLLLYAPDRPAAGQARVTVLDVGQGLSAVVETRLHTLVFDAGPWLSPRFDAGTAAIVPYLRQAGTRRVDRFILSHGDDDHDGGAPSLRENATVVREMGNAGEGACHRGQHWEWEGVRFDVLHPAADDPLDGNNRSCVLRVSAGRHALLLTGDIEATAEALLLQREGERLAADLVLAPHHGSRTSSTEAWIGAVSPHWVVFSTGYRNRFGFPAPDVVARYRAVGARSADTATAGAVSIRLGGEGEIAVESFRQRSGRYWNATPALCRDPPLC